MALGLVPPAVAGAVLVLAIALGVLLSATAIAVEELTYHRYGRGRDLLALMGTAVVEHLWFRWAHSWYRLRGLVAALTRGRRCGRRCRGSGSPGTRRPPSDWCPSRPDPVRGAGSPAR